jgi:hypothetical protein
MNTYKIRVTTPVIPRIVSIRFAVHVFFLIFLSIVILSVFSYPACLTQQGCHKFKMLFINDLLKLQSTVVGQ